MQKIFELGARKPKIKPSEAGFTLAELLIALAILGVIATFTIPKILHGQADAERKAIFKEVISAISEMNYTGYIQNKLELGTGSCAADRYNITYFRDNLNHVQFCSSAFGDGCYVQVSGSCAGGSGHILPNGASTCGFGFCTTSTLPQDLVFIDWDGPNKGANTQGDDQLNLMMCFGDNCDDGLRPGEVKPNNATSQTLYEEIFSN